MTNSYNNFCKIKNRYLIFRFQIYMISQSDFTVKKRFINHENRTSDICVFYKIFDDKVTYIYTYPIK